MSSEFEDKLGVDNGFPIVDFDQGRGGVNLDMLAVRADWRDWLIILTTEYPDVQTDVLETYDDLLLIGKHPQVAAEEAAQLFDIWEPTDTFIFE